MNTSWRVLDVTLDAGFFMSPLFWLVRGFVVGETSSLSIWQQMQEDML